MNRDTCRMMGCDNDARGLDHDDVDDGFAGRFCSQGCELKFEHIKADADDSRRTEPTRSEPADFGHGESTGVQDL